VLWWIFQLLDGLLGRFLYPALGGMVGRETFVMPGLGLLVLFLLLVFIGWAAQRAIGSRIVAWWHRLLERLPLTRRIYSAQTASCAPCSARSRAAVQAGRARAVPIDGRWAIGFLSGTAPAAIQRHVPGAVSHVRAHHAEPDYGFLIIVPPDVTPKWT
jgi:uncharacterized membrane protein